MRNRSHLGRAILLGVLLALFSGCEAPTPALRVALGNYAYGRGNYQQALVHYLVGAESQTRRPWFEYNIGNVYHALGEAEAALEMWDSAARSEDASIQFGTSFNKGVLYYEMGRFVDAYESFRHALKVDSSNREAKVNLELSLAKLQAESSADVDSGGESPEPQEEPDRETLRILEYVRRKEEQEWSANRELSRPAAERDW